jgi:hypothetical protein
MHADAQSLQVRTLRAWQDWALALGVNGGKRDVERALSIPAECMSVGFGSAWTERLEAAIFMVGSGRNEWARAYRTRMRGSWGAIQDDP